jgi:hypothetical protein
MINQAEERRVYIVNFQTKNFNSAKKYGELVYITQGYLDLKKIDEYRSKLERYVDMASPTDSLILNGPAVINTLLTILWFRKFGYLNILSWDGRAFVYSHNVVGLSERSDTDEGGKVTVGQ